jgi:trehalose synthase
MLHNVNITQPKYCNVQNPFDCFKTLTPNIYEETVALARELRGLRIMHLNATDQGGGVAELLRGQVALERAIGFSSEWFIINPDKAFFNITKKIHNLLQGNSEHPLTKRDQQDYLLAIQSAKDEFRTCIEKQRPDVIIVHDPQVLPFVEYIPKYVMPIFRMHLYTADPHAETLEFLRPMIERFPRLIVTNDAYRPHWYPETQTDIIAPAINPFSQKNRVMSHAAAQLMLAERGVHMDRPVLSQVSRFDIWKDPEGVISAYYSAKRHIPDLQLILAGSAVNDHAISGERSAYIHKHAAGDPDIYIFEEYNDTLINAVQTASSIIIQKSLREAFGLTVTEAMWKARPVIGGNTIGIAMQIINQKNGLLVSSPGEAAAAIVRLCQHPELGTRLGASARRMVQKKFLFSRYLRDHVRTYRASTTAAKSV